MKNSFYYRKNEMVSYTEKYKHLKELVYEIAEEHLSYGYPRIHVESLSFSMLIEHLRYVLSRGSSDSTCSTQTPSLTLSQVYVRVSLELPRL